MRRLVVCLLLAVGGMGASGCQPEGSYRLQWAFTPAPGVVEVAAEGCGAHGVDAILIEAVGSEGGHVSIVPCADGSTTRTIIAATWGFNVHALGPDGRFKEPLPPPPAPWPTILHEILEPRPIAEDSVTDLEMILFEPQPQCRDGVDNDRDGRVDTDDQQCGGDPQAGSESAPPPTQTSTVEPW